MRKKKRRTLPPATPVDAERIAYRRRVETFLASHDAGVTLTRDALGAGVSADALVAAAADTARFADEALQIVLEDYRPTVACREGCSYCCRKPGVLVSLPELLRLLAYVDSTFEPDSIADLKVRVARYVEQLQGRHFNDLVSDSVPCPLLVGERCSVYEARPLVCRGFNSTSVDACHDAHASRERSIPMFVMLKDVTDGTTVGAAHQLKEAGVNDSMVDLGTALHLALQCGDIAQSLVPNGRALEAAEDPSWVGGMWARVCEVARDVGIKVSMVDRR